MREEMIEKKYEEMGISKEVYLFGKKIEDELKERFAAIDATAEYNQMKVIDAMQKNRVSAECFAMSNGYGYNDLGRDTLEKVYASCFHGEDALVRPQITCGTPCTGTGIDVKFKTGGRIIITGRKTVRYLRGSYRYPTIQRLTGRIWHYLSPGRFTFRWQL